MTHANTHANKGDEGDSSSPSDEETDSDEPDGNRRQAVPDGKAGDSTARKGPLREEGAGSRKERMAAYIRASGVVFRAMHLLEEWKYITARITSAKVPVDLIALRKDVVLLVQVISSRKPITDTKAVLRHFAVKIQNLRSMGTLFQFRKILMAYSRSGGWMTYDVYPNGLVPAWNVQAVPDT